MPAITVPSSYMREMQALEAITCVDLCSPQLKTEKKREREILNFESDSQETRITISPLFINNYFPSNTVNDVSIQQSLEEIDNKLQISELNRASAFFS